MELYTDLSTLSTKNEVEKMVYIVFSENRCFVDSDKIEERKKNSTQGLDRKAFCILRMLTEYSE